MQPPYQIHLADLPSDVRAATLDTITAVVEGRFDEIERLGRAGLGSASDLREAVKEYGATLVPLPLEGFDLIGVLVTGESLWRIDVPLWTREEGRSDLQLSMTVEYVEGRVNLAIDGIWVP